MSGGLEAIAMVALQELKEKQNSDSSTGADQKTPASTSTTVVASRSDVVSDGTDNAQLLSQGDNHVQVQVQQQGQQDLSTDDARGPSAVVTPTASSPSTTAAVLIDAGSQEQQEEKKPDPDHYHHHQEGTDAHTARVVSFENMVGCCSTSQPSAPSRASSNSSQVTPPAVPNSEDDCPGASSSATMISSDNVSQDPSSTTATTTGGVPVNHHKEGGLADFSHILADPEGWLRTNEPHFAVALASGNVDTKEVIVNIQPNDVLCGRGGETNHWTVCYVTSILYSLFTFACRLHVSFRQLYSLLVPLSTPGRPLVLNSRGIFNTEVSSKPIRSCMSTVLDELNRRLHNASFIRSVNREVAF